MQLKESNVPGPLWAPTEVQERLIPLIAKGKNIIGQSQTGTGKTHTFLLPLFEKINADKEEVQVVIFEIAQ